MKISVIIPVFNAAGGIAQTLERLLQSRWGDREIIVVDDASTDETTADVERFPVTLVRLDRNGGAAVARNRGSHVATGEILFFIDADVWVTPETLTTLHQTFLEPPQPAAVVGCYSPAQPLVNFYSRFQNFYTWFNHDRCLTGDRGPITWFWTACGAIRREIFNRLGGFREIYTGASAEDMDLGYRLSDEGLTIVLNKALEVTHVHRHTFGSIRRNNMKKAAAWGELYFRKKAAGRYKHGFTSQRNFVTLILVALIGVTLPLVAASAWFLLILALELGLVAFSNREFYDLMYRQQGLPFLVRAFAFHLLATFFAGLGALIAIQRLVLGKEGERSAIS